MDKALTFLDSTILGKEDIMAIMNLWNQEYPANLSHTSTADFEAYTKSLLSPNHILIRSDNYLIGWATKFDRGAERWFVIILSRIVHGKGLGTELMNKLKKNEQRLSGWVIDHDFGIKTDGTIYRSPLGFYIKNGFIPSPDQRLELPHLSAVKVTWDAKI